MAVILIPIIFMIDQFTKNKAEEFLEKGKRYQLGEKLNIGLIYNKGAFLGFLGNHKILLWIFSLGSLVAILIIGAPIMMMKGAHLMKFGICSILGGATGNLYDRFKKGKVVDFFSLWFKPKVFLNIADVFVIGGAFIFAFGALFQKK